MKTLIRKLIPKTTWCKVNLALTILMFLAYGGLRYMEATMNNSILVPHPGDCSKYYAIINGVLIEHDCPAGLYFCPELQMCDWDDDNMCSYHCPKGGGGSGYRGVRMNTCYPVLDQSKLGFNFYSSCHPATIGDIIFPCGGFSNFEPVWIINECYEFVY